MTTLGTIHLVSAIAALGLGATVLLYTRKGTRLHRQLGWSYVVAMLVLNVTALTIYRLFGFFGPFHVFALMSLATLLLGVGAAVGARRRREARISASREKWVGHHYYWMTYSYLGLVAAGVAETTTRLPALQPHPSDKTIFGIAVGVATVAVFAIGSRLIKRRAERQVAPFVPRG